MLGSRNLVEDKFTLGGGCLHDDIAVVEEGLEDSVGMSCDVLDILDVEFRYFLVEEAMLVSVDHSL